MFVQAPVCPPRRSNRLGAGRTAPRLATLRCNALCRALLPRYSSTQRAFSASSLPTIPGHCVRGLAPAQHQHNLSQHNQQQQQARGNSTLVRSQKKKTYSFEVEYDESNTRGQPTNTQAEQVSAKTLLAFQHISVPISAANPAVES